MRALLERAPPAFWHGFTWLGDSALMMPSALLIALWLLASRRTVPTALMWLLVFGAGASLILASKLAFMGWCIGSARLNFTGFSGHTALSTSIWPIALWLAASRAPARWRAGIVLVGWGIGAAIGVSRLALGAHSVSEVTLGFGLGVLVSGGFLLLQQRKPPPNLWWPVVVLSLVTPLVLLTPGKPAPTQTLLEQIAMRLAGIERPYRREDLLRRG